MIGYLRGQVISVGEDYLILDVGGVGYRITTNTAVLKGADEVELYIHSHIRDDRFDLYGFSTKGDLDLFELLLDVRGVGPKVAMSAVSTLGVDDLINSILLDDPKSIQSVSGIGKKGSERIVLELKGKLEKLGYSSSEEGAVRSAKISSSVEDEVISALEGLGYTQSESKKRLAAISSEVTEVMSVEELIKMCLSQ